MASPQFPFNDAVPQSAQKISPTQSPILNNFQSINELINVNHVGFNDVINFGKHTVTTFPIQSILPTTGVGEMNIYAAATTTTNGLELFYQYPNNGARVQLTGSGNSNYAYQSGYSYLTGTLLIKWGLATGLVTGTNTITFPTGGSYPAFSTSVTNVQFTAQTAYSIPTSGNGNCIAQQRG